MDNLPKERLLIIKNYNKGMKLRKIGEVLDIPHTKAYYWIKRYKKYNINGLKTIKQKGKTPLLSQKDLTKIREYLVNNKPKEYYGISAGWNSRGVKSYIKSRYNASYSLRHIERLLHKIGFSLMTPRPRNIKASPEKQNEFKKNLKKNIWICR
mgnify:CR=1 FL=1